MQSLTQVSPPLFSNNLKKFQVESRGFRFFEKDSGDSAVAGQVSESRTNEIHEKCINTREVYKHESVQVFSYFLFSFDRFLTVGDALIHS